MRTHTRTLLSGLSTILVLAAGTNAVSAAPAYQTTKTCVADTVNGGRYCGQVRLYSSGPVRSEGREGIRYTECESGRDVKYLGWSSRNLSDGGTYVTARSVRNPERFHLYKITRHEVAREDCDFPNI